MKLTADSNRLTVSFEEDILSTSVETMRRRILDDINGSKEPLGEIVADISGAKMIDSQGLNLLVGLFRECERRNARFRVQNASDEHRRLFSYMNLSTRFGL